MLVGAFESARSAVTSTSTTRVEAIDALADASRKFEVEIKAAVRALEAAEKYLDACEVEVRAGIAICRRGSMHAGGMNIYCIKKADSERILVGPYDLEDGPGKLHWRSIPAADKIVVAHFIPDLIAAVAEAVRVAATEPWAEWQRTPR